MLKDSLLFFVVCVFKLIILAVYVSDCSIRSQYKAGG